MLELERQGALNLGLVSPTIWAFFIKIIFILIFMSNNFNKKLLQFYMRSKSRTQAGRYLLICFFQEGLYFPKPKYF